MHPSLPALFKTREALKTNTAKSQHIHRTVHCETRGELPYVSVVVWKICVCCARTAAESGQTREHETSPKDFRDIRYFEGRCPSVLAPSSGVGGFPEDVHDSILLSGKARFKTKLALNCKNI